MSRIAIYSRKSKETDTGESIKNQIQMCKDYFLRKGEKHTFEIFQDEGFSGGNTNRPEFQRMMLLAKHGQFDIIACYKVDRIGRNIVDFMNTFSELEKNNITLVSVTEGFDPSTPAGRMMMTMIAGFAEMERMNIAQRVKDNMDSLAKLGRWSGGTPPTGYRAVRLSSGDKTAMYLEFLPEWEDKICTIFKYMAEGRTAHYVSKNLNMSSKTIQNLINNPVYCKSDSSSKSYLEKLGFTVYGELNGCGYLPYNRRPKAKNGKKLFNADGMFVAVSRHYAPIDSSLWILANEQLKKRGQDSRPRISQYSFLAHMVKCSCGSGMYITPGRYRNDGSRSYYFCCSSRKYYKNCSTKRVNATFLEEDILEILKNIENDKSVLDKYINTISKTDNSNKIKDLKDKLKKNNRMLDSLAEKLALLEGKALAVTVDKMNLLSREIDNINNQVLKLEREDLLNGLDENNICTLQNNIKELLNAWDKINLEQKQYRIQSIIKEIKLLKTGRFKIEFNI